MKIYLKPVNQIVYKELRELGLLKVITGKDRFGNTIVIYKNYRVANEHKPSKAKTYYIEHQDFTEKDYANMKKYGRKSPNILDEYYSIIG